MVNLFSKPVHVNDLKRIYIASKNDRVNGHTLLNQYMGTLAYEQSMSRNLI